MSADDLWLSNDLVQELSNQGCAVNVIAFGEENIARRRANIFENVIKIDLQFKVLKYLILWPKLFYLMLSQVLKNDEFDQVIVFAPVSVMWPAVFLVRFLKSTKKTVVMFDIYPVHQVKIGALPSFVEWPLKFIEKNLLASFTEITAMGERNQKYIEKYYSTSKLRCTVKILNLWGRGVLASNKDKRYDKVIRIVFGGQIIKGREVDSLIDFLGKLRERGLSLTLDIYSRGTDYEALRSIYSGRDWVSFRKQLPRDEYFKQLSSYHVGAIVTDKKSDLPTFPSKIIDYVESGLGVYCMVEKESELYTLVDDYSIIHINPFCFSNNEIERSLAFFKGLDGGNIKEQISELRQFFSVQSSVSRLIG